MSIPGDGSTRVGNAEREVAIEALNEHWRAGRLDPSEHEARTTRAYAAVTRADLDALFTDLPSEPLQGSVMPAPGQPYPVAQSGTQPPAVPSQSQGSGLFPADSWIGRKRDAIMGVTPFAATALFFMTGNHWQWFLAIPAMGAALYAGDTSDDRGRAQRRLDRDERRRLRRERD